METAILILAAAAFSVGALVIAFEGSGRTPSERARTGLHVFAAVVAALAYAVMANGAGVLSSQGGPFPAPRFLLWIVTGPALFVALALAAFPAGQRNVGLTVALGLAAGAAFVALGISALIGGLSHWVWFAVAVALLAGAMAIVWLPLREYAEAGHPVRREIFTALAGVVSVLFALVPLVFLLSGHGAGLIGAAWTTAFYAVIDIGLVVGSGLVAVWTGRQLARAAASERDGTAIGPAKAFRQPTRPVSAPGGAGLRETALRRAREEWERSRRRLREIAERRVHAGGGGLGIGGPAAPGRLRLPDLGRPPRRLVLKGVAYGLVGPVRGTAAAVPRPGRPIAAGAEPPREVVVDGHRYRRIDPAPTAPAERVAQRPERAPRLAPALGVHLGDRPRRPVTPASRGGAAGPGRAAPERPDAQASRTAPLWFRAPKRPGVRAEASGQAPEVPRTERRPGPRETGRLTARPRARFPFRQTHGALTGEAEVATPAPAAPERQRRPSERTTAARRLQREAPGRAPAIGGSELVALARRAGLPTTVGEIPLRRMPPESAVSVVIVGGVLWWVCRRRSP